MIDSRFPSFFDTLPKEVNSFVLCPYLKDNDVNTLIYSGLSYNFNRPLDKVIKNVVLGQYKIHPPSEYTDPIYNTFNPISYLKHSIGFAVWGPIKVNLKTVYGKIRGVEIVDEFAVVCSDLGLSVVNITNGRSRRFNMIFDMILLTPKSKWPREVWDGVITGLKYDKTRKIYEKTVLDFMDHEAIIHRGDDLKPSFFKRVKYKIKRIPLDLLEVYPVVLAIAALMIVTFGAGLVFECVFRLVNGKPQREDPLLGFLHDKISAQCSNNDYYQNLVTMNLLRIASVAILAFMAIRGTKTLRATL